MSIKSNYGIPGESPDIGRTNELARIGERMKVLLTSAGLEPEEIQKYFIVCSRG